MSYPITADQVSDPWTRGKVEMFMRAVELHNKNPKQVSVDGVTKLYQEVKSDCVLNTKLIVQIKGEEMTE